MKPPTDLIAPGAEHLITTRYRKTVWKPFLSAMKRYGMTRAGDRIAVCVSGGKDSFLLAKCMQLLQKHSDTPFELCFLAMDPGYSAENLQTLLQTAQGLSLPLDLFAADIFRVLESGVASPCHVCAAMRRGHLYKAAGERGCNRIALGHNFDDVVETILLGLLYGSEFRTMLPRLRSLHYPGLELIRPLYFVREKAVIAWRDACGIPAASTACGVTRGGGGKRREMKELLSALEKMNPNAANSLFSSACAVDTSLVLGYRAGKNAPLHSFMEDFRDTEGPAPASGIGCTRGGNGAMIGAEVRGERI